MLRWRDASAWLRGALMAMLAFTLAACTTTPKPIEGIGPDAFSRIGRFAITVNEESGKQNAVQGGFSWSDDGRRYVLDLTNPLGSTEARVEGQPGSASLTKADGTRLVADNPDALAEDALGSSMPVSGLRDWLRGKLPAEPEPGELSRDELGRPAGFEQGGWRVRLSRYDTKGPMLLVMERQEPGVASWCGWWSTSPDASCAAAHARNKAPHGAPFVCHAAWLSCVSVLPFSDKGCEGLV